MLQHCTYNFSDVAAGAKVFHFLRYNKCKTPFLVSKITLKQKKIIIITDL